MDHIEEAVIEDDSGEWLPDDKFYTLTMAEILERQGLKRDALRIYKRLLKKGGQNSIAIQERIDKLSGHSFRANEEMKKDFIKWINKLQKGGN
ncbi:MAG: hypothetical protein HY266_03175 [Deltaproteobacteria bacterium]|nr:hypothetical protein [Deltaproteobacteria bacterium]